MPDELADQCTLSASGQADKYEEETMNLTGKTVKLKNSDKEVWFQGTVRDNLGPNTIMAAMWMRNKPYGRRNV